MQESNSEENVDADENGTRRWRPNKSLKCKRYRENAKMNARTRKMKEVKWQIYRHRIRKVTATPPIECIEMKEKYPTTAYENLCHAQTTCIVRCIRSHEASLVRRRKMQPGI